MVLTGQARACSTTPIYDYCRGDVAYCAVPRTILLASERSVLLRLELLSLRANSGAQKHTYISFQLALRSASRAGGGTVRRRRWFIENADEMPSVRTTLII
jgi:hypothetical protein